MFNVLSWGGGSQSSAILQLFLDNKVKLNAIIFADTGCEPSYVYKQINMWLQEPRIKAIYHKVQVKNNMESMINDYISGKKNYLRMIMFTYDRKTNHYGKHFKTCTGTYKIQPNQVKVRKLLREKYGKNWKEYKHNVFIGYSKDELRRANKLKNTDKITYRYPLIENNMDFKDTIDYLKKNNRTYKRSACFMCPFRNDSVGGMGWIDIINNDYKNFEKAIKWDIGIRNCENSKLKHSYSLYFSSECLPLWYMYKNSIDKKLLNYCLQKDIIGQLDIFENRKYKKSNMFKYSCKSNLGDCGL